MSLMYSTYVTRCNHMALLRLFMSSASATLLYMPCEDPTQQPAGLAQGCIESSTLNHTHGSTGWPWEATQIGHEGGCYLLYNTMRYTAPAYEGFISFLTLRVSKDLRRTLLDQKFQSPSSPAFFITWWPNLRLKLLRSWVQRPFYSPPTINGIQRHTTTGQPPHYQSRTLLASWLQPYLPERPFGYCTSL